MFRASVYLPEKLNKVDKFQYLISCLKGEPLDIIKGLDITDENFEVAWTLLCKRYQSERRHIFYHFNGLLDLPETKTANQVSALLSKFREHTQALEALRYPLECYDGVLTAVIIRRLSSHLKGRLEDYRDASTEYPKIAEVIDFLEKEVISCDELGSSKKENTKTASKNLLASSAPEIKSSNPQPTSKRGEKNKKTSSQKDDAKNQSTSEDTSAPVPFKFKCPYCQDVHPLYRCLKFRELSVPERIEYIKKQNRCMRCLNRHDIADCSNSHFTCLVCHKNDHHVLTHIEKPEKTANETTPSPNVKGLVGTSPVSRPHVLLATCQVKLTSPKGSILARGILDSAAQSTFLTTSCAERLKLKIKPTEENVEGISEVPTPIRGRANVNIFALNKNLAKNHEVSVIDCITGATPPVPLSPEIREKMAGRDLADPKFDVPGPVDILIGAKLFPHLINGELISLGPDLPVAMGTKMGYVVLGSTPTAAQTSRALIAASDSDVNLNLNFDLQKFWQLEEPKPANQPPPEDDAAEKHFVQNTVRLQSGKFMVRLPFSESPETLGESRSQALRRFEALERRFKADSKFQEQYVQYMEEYQNAGFMVLASPEVLNKPHYFLPHHGVVKETSSTTKLRVVYDGSAKTSSGISLNQILHVGPKILNDIRDVLFNFRLHRIAMTCDVRQMYNCIALHPEDQRFQLILWRPNSSAPLQIFQMTCVTFGIASSAFLAIRCLHELAHRHRDQYPRAAQAILDSFYVDDGCLGDRDEEAARTLRAELIELLARGEFELRKWKANDPSLLENVAPELIEAPTLWQSAQASTDSVLGLKWLPSEDCFSYQIHALNKPPTKRGLLSTSASIFCPAGWVSPTIFVAKNLMQQLWLSKIGWDERLPPTILKEWESYLQTLPNLGQIRIPRHLCPADSEIQIHGFCDASILGYGCVVYVRYATDEQQFKTTIVTGKSKVAPLKHSSLPRLELCGATLLASLMDHIVPLLKNKFIVTKIFAWTDSTVALHWIQTPSYKLKTFVANRVAQIQETLPETRWRHVKSTDNPADCASRGMTADVLATHDLWWNGPHWLCSPEEEWPASRIAPPTEELPETKSLALVVYSPRPNFDALLATKFSSWGKMLRVVALTLRFAFNAKNPEEKRFGLLTALELKESERRVIQTIQKACFPDELKRLSAKEPCSTRIRRLDPFLDEHGTLRVGGRLSSSFVSQERKHPALLPKKHPLLKLLIEHYHRIYLHAGPQFLESTIAARFWILSARRAIRSVIFNCIPCFRATPRNRHPLMGDLPNFRIVPSRPFSHVGVDFFGPFNVTIHTLKPARTVKAYICIFVCMCVKAVHFEITQDLTALSFLEALTRFASRRGNPRNVYCDNGSAFIGAKNEMSKIVKSLIAELPKCPELQRIIEERQIDFHFNTPAAPHQGGLWESMIKIAKKHLARVLQGHKVSFETLRTLTTRLEAMMNSRPLVARSSDPNDFEPITPAHFLIGAPLILPLEPLEAKIPKRPQTAKRWRLMQSMAQSLWKRWTAEYLHTLQNRNKWTERVRNPEVGDLVLIHEPSVTPLSWKLGRITSTYIGSQNQVRKAQVKTHSGFLTRPVSKLYPLPIAESE